MPKTMSKTKKDLPKKATTPPKISALVVLIVATIAYVPHTLPFLTNKASMQIIFTFMLGWVACLGIAFSYDAGLALAKLNHRLIKKGALIVPILILFAIQLLCTAGCVLHEIYFTGYPIELCFDTCQRVELQAATTGYLAVSTVFFAPAYFALFRYYSWTFKYHLPAPKKSQKQP